MVDPGPNMDPRVVSAAALVNSSHPDPGVGVGEGVSSDSARHGATQSWPTDVKSGVYIEVGGMIIEDVTAFPRFDCWVAPIALPWGCNTDDKANARANSDNCA